MSPSRGGDARARDAETRRARVDGDVGAHRGVVGRSGARVGDCEPDGGADAREAREDAPYATGTRYNTMDAR